MRLLASMGPSLDDQRVRTSRHFSDYANKPDGMSSACRLSATTVYENEID